MARDPYKTDESASSLWFEQAVNATVHIGAIAYGKFYFLNKPHLTSLYVHLASRYATGNCVPRRVLRPYIRSKRNTSGNPSLMLVCWSCCRQSIRHVISIRTRWRGSMSAATLADPCVTNSSRVIRQPSSWLTWRRLLSHFSPISVWYASSWIVGLVSTHLVAALEVLHPVPGPMDSRRSSSVASSPPQPVRSL